MEQKKKIKAIPTSYKGYEFRSKLEAQWAVFFDLAGASWEYEKQGYETEDGERYLPDFCLTDDKKPLYVEVKGEMDEDSAKKIISFSGASYDFTDFYGFCPFREYRIENPIYVVNNIPEGQSYVQLLASFGKQADKNHLPTKEPAFYNSHLVTGVRNGINPIIDTMGLLRFQACDKTPRPADLNEFLTVQAYNIARNAKFDHGRGPDKVIQKFNFLKQFVVFEPSVQEYTAAVKAISLLVKEL